MNIPKFPNYTITKDGKVFSKLSNKYLKPNPPTKHWKYERYVLYYAVQKKTEQGTHQLLAQTYIPNPDNLPIVDHIDKDPTNNSLENLRWRDKSGNCVNKRIRCKLGYRHISELHNHTYYQIGIRRNHKFIFSKTYRQDKYTLEEVVKIRNEEVYPMFNIEIDDD